jgi:hypothetical protein
MPSLSVPSRFKPRHIDVSSRLRGRRRGRREGRGSRDSQNGKQMKVIEVAFTMFPELQVRPKVLKHKSQKRGGNGDGNPNNDDKGPLLHNISSHDTSARTGVAINDVNVRAPIDSTCSQPEDKSTVKRRSKLPFSEVAPSIGSFFNFHCACIDIDHVLDVEEEFDNQVFLQAKAARILKRKAVDMKLLKFGRQLGQGGKERGSVS